ncbi:MAG: hypothetical protein ABI846_14120 [Rudaea sp.]
MNAAPLWEELSAFVDGELEPARAGQIASHVQHDSTLRRQVQEIGRLSAALKAPSCYFLAPKTLRSAVCRAAAERSRPKGSTVLSRWFAWRPMASALALAGLFALSIRLADPAVTATDRLQEEIVASHLRATMSRRLVDLESADPRALAPFLSSRLDFAPSISELDVAGSSLVGGRIDYVDGRTVAAVVYRVGDHVLDSFVWPTGKGDQRVTQTSKRGFQIARWSRGGMAHCLISDVSAEQLSAIVRQLESSIAGRTSS